MRFSNAYAPAPVCSPTRIAIQTGKSPAADPNETHDLAKSRPVDAERLTQALHDWQRETGAALPRDANPDYDPKAERPRGRQGGAGGDGGKGGGRQPRPLPSAR